MNNQLIGALDIGSYKTKFLISSLDDKNFLLKSIQKKLFIHRVLKRAISQM